jgi:general secretion pathway protein B
MSLILEALKKSEQQRKLGEAPTLGSPVVATRKRRSFLPVIALLIVVGAGAWWYVSRTPSTPPDASSAKVTADGLAPVTGKAPTGAALSKPIPTAEQTPAQKAAAARRASIEEKRKQIAEHLKPGLAKPPTVSNGANDRPLIGVTAPPAQVMPPPAATAAPDKKTIVGAAAPVATPAPAPAAVPPATAPKPVAPTADAKTAPPPAAAAPPKTAAPAPVAAALPTVWDLPYSTRKDIPAIDLSMHVYSADPKERFAVIKGERHAEGDDLGNDLVLREIRQDGLVLEYKGTKFFFPRTGR